MIRWIRTDFSAHTSCAASDPFFGFLRGDDGGVWIPSLGLHAECNGDHGHLRAFVREFRQGEAQCGFIPALLRPAGREQS